MGKKKNRKKSSRNLRILVLDGHNSRSHAIITNVAFYLLFFFILLPQGLVFVSHQQTY